MILSAWLDSNEIMTILALNYELLYQMAARAERPCRPEHSHHARRQQIRLEVRHCSIVEIYDTK